MIDQITKRKERLFDFQTLMFDMRKKKKDILFWIAGIAFTIFIFFCISSKEYSFLLVLSSLVQMLSFLIILIKVYHFQNCSGLSANTLLCYAILLVSRLSSTLFYSGYLPSDKSGDWFYQLTEIVCLLCACLLYFMVSRAYKDTADTLNDVVDYSYLVIPCLSLAFLVHTSLNRNVVTDVLWSFSMYLEGVAMFPQIKLFLNKKGQIESYTSHYVALQGLSRLLSLIFWWYTYTELNSSRGNSGYSLFQEYCGYFIVLSQIIQLIIMLDYYYLYFKSLIKGEEMSVTDI